MGFRHDRASAGRSHEPLARGAHGAGPARTVLAGLVAVATLATGGLVASTAYAGGAGDNRPGGATGGLPAGMFWQYKDDASGSFGPAANADGSPRIASVEAAYKRAGVSVVNDGVYDGPGAIRDTLRGALSKCVAGFRQRHPGEGDGDCRVVGVGSVAGQQGGRWVYNGSISFGDCIGMCFFLGFLMASYLVAGCVGSWFCLRCFWFLCRAFSSVWVLVFMSGFISRMCLLCRCLFGAG